MNGIFLEYVKRPVNVCQRFRFFSNLLTFFFRLVKWCNKWLFEAAYSTLVKYVSGLSLSIILKCADETDNKECKNPQISSFITVQNLILNMKTPKQSKFPITNAYLSTHRRIRRARHSRGARHTRGGRRDRQPRPDHHLRRQDPDGHETQRVPTQSRGQPQHVPARPEGCP